MPLPAPGNNQLAAGSRNRLCRRYHQINALLVNKPRHETEQGPSRYSQSKALSHTVGISPPAPPIAGRKSRGKILTSLRMPGFVDSIDDASQPVLGCPHPQQPVETAPKFRRRNFLGIGFTYGRHMARIGNARFEEGRLSIEFHAIDAEGPLGSTDARKTILWE